MKTRLTLKPGQNGTKKLQAKYGDRLVAVRFRYDAAARRRLKTVELIEEVLPWDPPAPRPNRAELVAIRLSFDEIDLRESVKSAGAMWLPERKLWRLPYRLVEVLGLTARIVPDQDRGQKPPA